MDGPWPQDALFVFALGLPSSMIAWTVIARSAGWLRERSDQPAWFRFIAARSRSWGTGDPPVRGEIALALAFWGLYNVPAAGLLAIWPYGWLGRLIPIVYFLVQGIWLLDMRRAIIRARSRHDDS